MSYKRYFCDVCMETDHDHLPAKIFNLVGKSQEQWLSLDQLLHNIEREFFLKMQSYSALLTHFDDFAKSKNLNTEQTATSRMRELDKVKESFNKDLNEKDADSINELIQGYKAIELIEIKENLRKEYEVKIKNLQGLAEINEKGLGPIYKEVLEQSGGEDWKDLYTEKKNIELNRDMYLRLKLQNMNELRRQDTEKIKKLERQVQLLMARMNINSEEALGEEEDM